MCVGGSPTAKDTCSHTCGDNFIVGTEECEDGNTVSGDGCSSSCMKEAGFTHNTVTNGTGHQITTSTPICGDTMQVQGEACDDGLNTDSQGCKNDCSGPINGYTCTGGSLTSVMTCTETCGDNFITHSEQCEDGNTANLDGCSSTCQKEDGWTHATTQNATFHDNTVSTPICGDSKRVSAENCDDGLGTANEGCKPGCVTGPYDGWHCSGGTPTNADSCVTQCGDGHIAGLEVCEDGNTANLDGCDSACKKEDGWT